jgi:hypothetical protein
MATASTVRYRMPLGALLPIVLCEALALTAVVTGIGGSGTSNAKAALPRPSTALNATLAVAAFVLVVTIVRTLRLSVELGANDLVVRNFWRTYRLPWSDVVDVAPPKELGSLRKAGLLITVRDGRVVSASAFVRGRFSFSMAGERAATALQQRMVTGRQPNDTVR